MKAQLRYSPDLLRQMWDEHVAGANMTELSRRHGYNATRIRMAFQRYLGRDILHCRPCRVNTGMFKKTMVRKSDDEVRALVKEMTRVVVHPALHTEWREWPMQRRKWWIRMVQEHLGPEHCRPPGPYSANVEPFGCVVRYRDGNPNNLDPSNLTAASRDDLARENQAASLAQKSNLRLKQLLKLNTSKNHDNDLGRILGRAGAGSSRNRALAELVLHVLHSQIWRKPLKNLEPSPEGLEYFRALQSERVQKIRSMFDLPSVEETLKTVKTISPMKTAA